MSLDTRTPRKPTPPELLPRVERAVHGLQNWREDERGRDGIEQRAHDAPAGAGPGRHSALANHVQHRA